MSGSDPKPWLEEGASGDLRTLLESARGDGPSPAQLQSVAAKLGPLLAGTAAVTAPALATKTATVAGKTAVAAKTALAAKLIVSVAAVGVVGGAFQAGRVYQEKVVPPRVVEKVVRVEVPAVAPVAPIVEPEPTPVIEPEPVPIPVKPKVAPLPVTPEAEAALLESAMGALKGGDAAKALAVCNAHAKRFGNDALLAQEREAIAIEALVKLGRRQEARERASKFQAAWPTSTHLLKVQALVAD